MAKTIKTPDSVAKIEMNDLDREITVTLVDGTVIYITETLIDIYSGNASTVPMKFLAKVWKGAFGAK